VADPADRREVERLSPPLGEAVAPVVEVDHTVRLPAAGPRPPDATTDVDPDGTTVRMADSRGRRALMLRLVPVDPVTGRATGESLTVTAPGASLGRGPGADIQLSDPHVSRDHAQLRHAQSGWTITDRDSTGGTRVDGVRISPGAPHPVGDGALVEFGSPGEQGPRPAFRVSVVDGA
jgi:hypothetical protein